MIIFYKCNCFATNNYNILCFLIIENLEYISYLYFLFIMFILTIRLVIFEISLINIFFMINYEYMCISSQFKTFDFRNIRSCLIETFPDLTLNERKTDNLMIYREIILLFRLIIIGFW